MADTSCACQTCGKHFNTANAYENHLKSKKHREAVAKQDKCLMPDVQQMNAKNDGRTKDSTYSGNQQQCDSGVKSTAGAVGGVTEHLQQDRDIGNCLSQLIIIYLIYVINKLLLLEKHFWTFFWIDLTGVKYYTNSDCHRGQ